MKSSAFQTGCWKNRKRPGVAGDKEAAAHLGLSSCSVLVSALLLFPPLHQLYLSQKLLLINKDSQNPSEIPIPQPPLRKLKSREGKSFPAARSGRRARKTQASPPAGPGHSSLGSSGKPCHIFKTSCQTQGTWIPLPNIFQLRYQASHISSPPQRLQRFYSKTGYFHFTTT